MAKTTDIEKAKKVRKLLEAALDLGKTAPQVLGPGEMQSIYDIAVRLRAYERGTTPMKHFSC